MKQATNKVSEDLCANSVQVGKQQRDYIAAIPLFQVTSEGFKPSTS
tara:strand:- start:506 stop:643 length:138 start_codon:yes stop_codon:yes gene_type:complete